MAFKRVIIRRVGPLFWLLEPIMKLSKMLLSLLPTLLLMSCSQRTFPDNANLPAEGLRSTAPAVAPAHLKIPAKDSSPLFVGVDLAKLKEPAKSAVLEAIVDFDRVKSGLPPACKAEPDSAFSDGGTAIYECKHYQLTVMKSLYQVGDSNGFIYGPIIKFPGDYPISDVRFYTDSELQLLLKE
jgi:hypothetical protein